MNLNEITTNVIPGKLPGYDTYAEDNFPHVIPGKKSSEEINLERNSQDYTPQDLGLEDMDDDMNFGGDDNLMNSNNGNLTEIQKAFLGLTAEVKLLDNKMYRGKLKYVTAGFTSKSNTPFADFIYEIFANGGYTEAHDTYVFDPKNPKYMYFTIKKLKETLERLGYNLNINDVADTTSIVNTCSCLIGTQVKIEQYDYNGYKKYNVYALY